jgi:hypothetical protein
VSAYQHEPQHALISTSPHPTRAPFRWTAKKEVKAKLTEKYLEGSNPWFFAKLRF